MTPGIRVAIFVAAFLPACSADLPEWANVGDPPIKSTSVGEFHPRAHFEARDWETMGINELPHWMKAAIEKCEFTNPESWANSLESYVARMFLFGALHPLEFLTLSHKLDPSWTPRSLCLVNELVPKA